MAPLLVFLTSVALLAVWPIMSVEAPWRMLISGHSISSGAPATGCGEVAVDLEKKPSIFSVKDGEAAGTAVDGADVDVAGAGADEMPGILSPPLAEHPAASNATANKVATAALWPGRIRWRSRSIPQPIASARDVQDLYQANRGYPKALPSYLAQAGGEAGGADYG